jgi:hypothetical protein
MSSEPVVQNNPQRLLPLAINTHKAISPTQRRSDRRRPIPPASPVPLRPLPPIPPHNESLMTCSPVELFTKPDPGYEHSPYSPSSPSFSQSVSSTITTDNNHMYPPTQHLTAKPSAQSLKSRDTCLTSPQNLFNRYPGSGFSEIRGNWVCRVESINGRLVWIGSEVAVLVSDDESGYTEYLRGRLISMCDRRKNVAWFVIKDSDTGNLHFAEVKNQMVKWPFWYKLLSYIDSLRTYIHHSCFGHQLPL